MQKKGKNDEHVRRDADDAEERRMERADEKAAESSKKLREQRDKLRSMYT